MRFNLVGKINFIFITIQASDICKLRKQKNGMGLKQSLELLASWITMTEEELVGSYPSRHGLDSRT